MLPRFEPLLSCLLLFLSFFLAAEAPSVVHRCSRGLLFHAFDSVRGEWGCDGSFEYVFHIRALVVSRKIRYRFFES